MMQLAHCSAHLPSDGWWEGHQHVDALQPICPAWGEAAGSACCQCVCTTLLCALPLVYKGGCGDVCFVQQQTCGTVETHHSPRQGTWCVHAPAQRFVLYDYDVLMFRQQGGVARCMAFRRADQAVIGRCQTSQTSAELRQQASRFAGMVCQCVPVHAWMFVSTKVWRLQLTHTGRPASHACGP
jgi:hypothetical protein